MNENMINLNSHTLRKGLGLTMNEMGVLAEIEINTQEGWCDKSKESIANTIDLSRGTVITIINKLSRMKYIVRSIDGKVKLTTFLKIKLIKIVYAQ
jgi:DNA-binding MarR family transcriptional regulator